MSDTRTARPLAARLALVAAVAALPLALAACGPDGDGNAERAEQLGCADVPADVTAAITASLRDGWTLGPSTQGIADDAAGAGSWVVDADLQDPEGLTQEGAFVVTPGDPATVSAVDATAQKSSTATAGTSDRAADVLDCIYPV